MFELYLKYLTGCHVIVHAFNFNDWFVVGIILFIIGLFVIHYNNITDYGLIHSMVFIISALWLPLLLLFYITIPFLLLGRVVFKISKFIRKIKG